MNGGASQQERTDSAGLLLWILAVVNAFGGVLLMIRGGGDETVAALGIATLAIAVVFAGLGFFVRRGSQAAVIAAVIVLGLVLAFRMVPLLSGDLRVTHVVSVVVTAAVLVLVARAVRT